MALWWVGGFYLFELGREGNTVEFVTWVSGGVALWLPAIAEGALNGNDPEVRETLDFLDGLGL